MHRRFLVFTIAVLVVAPACGIDTTPAPSQTRASVPVEQATPTAAASSTSSPIATRTLNSVSPSPTPRATENRPTLPADACTNCGRTTIYLLKNATDFDYYDPQRIYTPEDEHSSAPPRCARSSPTGIPRTRRRQ